VKKSQLSFLYPKESTPFRVFFIISSAILLLFFSPPCKNGSGQIFRGMITPAEAQEIQSEKDWTSFDSLYGLPGGDSQSTTDSTIPWSGNAREKLSIGVILPLSGDYAPFGQSALKGIFLASGIFGPWSEELLPVEVIVKDSKGDPTITAKLVEELFREDVIAIIGPLLSKTSIPGVLKAQELQVPIISLSQKEDLPELGDYIFRNSMTSTMQARTLVHNIFFNLGLQKFAVLYPDNSYGRRLKDAFIKEVGLIEGEIVALESYEEDQTDFGVEIKKIFQVTEINENGRGKGKKTFKPRIEFDALYIPDYTDRVVLIVPQLVYYNVKDLQLLGSNGWNSPHLMEVEDEYIEGAIFTDGFFINSKNPRLMRFKEEFSETFKALPGILESHAFDAAKMIVSIVRDKGRIDRESLRNYLLELKGYQGVTGRITFDRKGEAQKELFLLKAENGRIVQVNWEEDFFKLFEEDYVQEYYYQDDQEYESSEDGEDEYQIDSF
jgi:branched-chain amino acid transport system substrate-binding protein